jgi:membrane protein DedA with SNARE-associated domain
VLFRSLAFGGYLVSTGQISFWMAVVFGVIGGTIAQIFVYWVGRYGGRPFLERYGKYIFISKHHIDLSEKWFNRYGTGVIFTARFIPVVRHAISIPAGIVRMPLLKFTILTTLAVIPWSILFVYLGKTLGENWEAINEKAAPYVKGLMWGAIAVVVLFFAYKWWMRAKKKSFTSGYTAAEMHNTERELQAVGKEYRVLHGRQVRSGSASHEIRHIVVGPNGVFHVENKPWAGDIHLAGQAEGKEDATAQSYRYEFVLKELLREHSMEADVVGIICFTHPDARLIGDSPAFVALKPDRLVSYIHSYKARHPLNEEQVNAIAEQIELNSKSNRR